MRERRERGSALIGAIIMVVVVGALVGSVTMMSSRSAERSRDASRRVNNDATIQTAVTRMTYALQNDLATIDDFYVLTRADLVELMEITGSQATVHEPASLPGLPPSLRQVDRVYEHVLEAGTHSLREVPRELAALDGAVVREPMMVPPSACVSSGLPPAACASGDLASYWQVFRVDQPDITGTEPPNVVVYLRSFMGSAAARSWTKASHARVELRPGRFADFQQISDGNTRIGAQATISGPVHSNGLADGSFSTVQEAPTSAASWIWMDDGASCVGQKATLSITRGVIRVPSGSTCTTLGETGQTISFLRAIDSIDSIRTARARGRDSARTFSAGSLRGAQTKLEPYDTAWDVTLSGTTAAVRYPNGGAYGTIPLDRVNAFVFDEDVKVRGTAAPDVRITIAAERSGGAAASIFVDGDLRKGDDRSSSIGLIAQGDIILWMENGAKGLSCPVDVVQAAMVAATGGVTIPTKYTTNEVQTTAPECGTVIVDGSVAGHRPPTLVWRWRADNGTTYAAGYDTRRDYRWDEQLKRNPPPYFPLTGSWQAFQVREANTDCLFDEGRKRDPRCR